MSDTKNACSNDDALKQAREGTCNGSLPENEYKPFSGPIASVLSEGADNGLHLEDLAAMFETDSRSVRLQIERERREGSPILSDNRSGYYLPACEYELRRFVGSMRGRAKEILKTARAVEEGGYGNE